VELQTLAQQAALAALLPSEPLLSLQMVAAVAQRVLLALAALVALPPALAQPSLQVVLAVSEEPMEPKEVELAVVALEAAQLAAPA
jgi:hypothetical protein